MKTLKVITPDNLGKGIKFNPQTKQWEVAGTVSANAPIKVESGAISLTRDPWCLPVIGNTLHNKAYQFVERSGASLDYLDINSMKGVDAQYPGVSVLYIKNSNDSNSLDKFLVKAGFTNDMIPGIEDSSPANPVAVYVTIETFMPGIFRRAGAGKGGDRMWLRGTLQRATAYVGGATYQFTRIPTDNFIPEAFEANYDYPDDGFYTPFACGYTLTKSDWLPWVETSNNGFMRKLKNAGLIS